MGYDGPLDDIRDSVVLDLEALDDEYTKSEQAFADECHAVKRSFEKKYAELLDKRRQVLQRIPEGSDAASSSGRSRATPAVPGFWRMVLQNSAEFQEVIERHDEPVLDYLGDVRVEWLDDESRDKGFKVLWMFWPNPYFSNTVLEKAYHTERKNKYADRVECVKITSVHIDWHGGKNVTVEVVSRKPKSGRRRPAKPRKEEVPRASFFRSCFRNLGPGEEIPEEELDDSEGEGSVDLMDCLMDDDYEQALALREHLIPHAIRWYTGEACDADDEELTESEGDGDDEHSEDSSEGEVEGEGDATDKDDEPSTSASHERVPRRAAAGSSSPKKGKHRKGT